MPLSKYIIGLDLGQSADPTALAVLERTPRLAGDGTVRRSYRGQVQELDVVHLERFHLGTPYPRIVAAVRELIGRPEVQPNPCLAVDATGVGRAVVDLFLDAKLPARLTPITITAGQGPARQDSWNDSGYPACWVAKIDLVSVVQAGFGEERLRIVPSLALADLLKRELLNFKVKVTAAANETFGAWREGDHDDLVLAVALAAWLAEFEPAPAGFAGPPVKVERERKGTYRRYDQPRRFGR